MIFKIVLIIELNKNENAENLAKFTQEVYSTSF